MGKVFYDMGFLSTAEVIECSATDLIGQYVGQTGPKTQKLLEKALGKVLFVDEAYRLIEGGFAAEALDELVDCLTKPKYSQKLVTILAGYDNDINRLMAMNPGLTSRFPEAIVFKSLSPSECATLMKTLLMKKERLDANSIQHSMGQCWEKMIVAFGVLSALPSWGNARDMQTLVKSIYGSLLKTSTVSKDSPKLVLGVQDIMSVIESMTIERTHRSDTSTARRSFLDNMGGLVQKLPTPTQNSPKTSFKANSKVEEPQCSTRNEPDILQETSDTERDAGVSDATWQQLHKDKLAAEHLEKEQQRIIQEEREQKARAEREEAEAKLEVLRLEEQAKKHADDEKLKQALEEARIQREMARRKRLIELAKIEEEAERVREEKRKEAEAQKKLRDLGHCVVGFRWIKQRGGYRCAGGSHFVSDANSAPI
jgi:hypothetical protein